ncbi:TetR family transcriptional regulator [Kribbella albertanoniae]|uniref:TetR family transcriptional regulator n=1 Tax=Kribbella albertanoniae TaxID=1266829 RepID=A0A4R4P3X5_9ACTN|nr:TetR/AcrR family transcriptional regulator [Kribbella albertanoniae]TDC14702.1 TetR family transcriptional regulator [Kribbella albertanoniae]
MTEGLRERKKRETRIALSWAAIRLVVEHGYGAVRLEDIAAEAGVSLRTFRNYFSSKAEAIAARQVERGLAVNAALRERPADEPLWDAVRVAVGAGFELGETGGGLQLPDEKWLAGVRLMVTEPALQGALAGAQAAVTEELTAVVAERTGTTGIYPRLVAEVIGAAQLAATHEWLHADPPRPMFELFHEVLDRITAGLPEPS